MITCPEMLIIFEGQWDLLAIIFFLRIPGIHGFDAVTTWAGKGSKTVYFIASAVHIEQFILLTTSLKTVLGIVDYWTVSFQFVISRSDPRSGGYWWNDRKFSWRWQWVGTHWWMRLNRAMKGLLKHIWHSTVNITSTTGMIFWQLWSLPTMHLRLST